MRFREAVANAKQSLREKSSHNACASYATILERIGKGKNGKKHFDIIENPLDVCHARMKPNKGGYKVATVVDMHNINRDLWGEEKCKAYNMYVDFITKESVFAPIFLQKGARALNNGGVTLDVKYPISFVAMAVFALRMGKERNLRLPIFKYLVDAGIPKPIAWVMFCCFEAIEGGKYYTVSIPGGHCAFNGNARAKRLFKLLSGDWSLFKDEVPFDNLDGQTWCVNKFLDDYAGKETTIQTKIMDFITKNKAYTTKQDGWGVPSFRLDKENLIAVANHLNEIMTSKEKNNG